jgi:hypothetical protein
MLDAVVISLVRRRAHVRRSMIHGQYIAMQKGQLRPICPSMAIAVAGITPGFAPTPPGIIATGHVKHATFQLDQAAVTLAYQPKGGFGGPRFQHATPQKRRLEGRDDRSDQVMFLKSFTAATASFDGSQTCFALQRLFLF